MRSKAEKAVSKAMRKKAEEVPEKDYVFCGHRKSF